MIIIHFFCVIGFPLHLGKLLTFKIRFARMVATDGVRTLEDVNCTNSFPFVCSTHQNILTQFVSQVGHWIIYGRNLHFWFFYHHHSNGLVAKGMTNCIRCNQKNIYHDSKWFDTLVFLSFPLEVSNDDHRGLMPRRVSR